MIVYFPMTQQSDAPALGGDFDEVMQAAHTDDLFFVSYITVDESDELDPARLNKRSVLPPSIRRLFTTLVLDFDAPDEHKAGGYASTAWREDFDAKTDGVQCIRYHTAGGARLVFAHPQFDCSPEVHEAWLRGLMVWAREQGLTPDPSCKDWTRLFRLPYVDRKSKPYNDTWTAERVALQGELAAPPPGVLPLDLPSPGAGQSRAGGALWRAPSFADHPVVQAGGRNSAINAFTFRLAAATGVDATEMGMRFAAEKCDPPYEEQDLARTVFRANAQGLACYRANAGLLNSRLGKLWSGLSSVEEGEEAPEEELPELDLVSVWTDPATYQGMDRDTVLLPGLFNGARRRYLVDTAPVLDLILARLGLAPIPEEDREAFASGEVADPDEQPFVTGVFLGALGVAPDAGFDDWVNFALTTAWRGGDARKALRSLNNEVAIAREKAQRKVDQLPPVRNNVRTAARIKAEAALAEALEPLDQNTLDFLVELAKAYFCKAPELQGFLAHMGELGWPSRPPTHENALREKTDVCLSQRIVEDLGDVVHTEGEILWRWEGRYWEQLSNNLGEFRTWADRYAGYPVNELGEVRPLGGVSHHFYTQAANGIPSQAPGVEQREFFLYDHPELRGVAFDNGFTRGDGVLHPHDKDQRADLSIQGPYTEEDPAVFISFLNDLFALYSCEDRAKAIEVVAGFIGVTLTGTGTKTKQTLLLVSPKTDTGKSTLVRAIQGLLPENRVVSVQTGQGESAERWAKGSLRGKLLNVVDDLNPQTMQDGGWFKSAVDGGLVTGEDKGKPSFTYKPVASHLAACNTLPAAKDMTEGFYRRWLVLPCENQVEAHKIDKELLVKIKAEANLIASWGLRALRRLIANNWTYDAPSVSTEEKTAWRERDNAASAFVSWLLANAKEGAMVGGRPTRIDSVGGWRIYSVQQPGIYQAYQTWAGTNGLEARSRSAFFQDMLNVGADVTPVRFSGVTSPVRCYRFRLGPALAIVETTNG